MTITTTEQILLIILSSALAIFLIIGIILGIKLIKIMDSIKRIADHAENVAENVEQTAAMFQKAAGPMAILKVLGNLGDLVQKRTKK